MAATTPIHFTGDPEADAFLGASPLALMIGFVLDQQVTVQKAFSSPLELSKRLGGLDATAIAAMDPAELEEVFREKPALHRFPANMARRMQEFCAAIASEYDGDAAAVWNGARDGADLEQRLLALPGHRRDEGAHDRRRAREAPRRPAAGLGGVRARRTTASATSTPRRRSPSTRRPSAPARPRCGGAADRLSAMPIELRTLTDGGQTPDRDRPRARRRSSAPRARASTSRVYDVRFETDAGALVLATLLAAQQRGVAIRLVYNVDHPGPIPVPPPPETMPEAIEALPVPTRAIAGHSRPDAPQVRRPRRHRRLVRLDELDGRLVEPPGERDRARARRAGARTRVHAQPRRAVGARHRRAHGPRRAAAGRRRRRHRGAGLVHARVRRRALPPGREVPRPGAAADPDRVAGADLGPDPRHARRGRERAPLRRRRRDRRDAGRRGVPPVGDERRQRLEDPAAAHGAHRGAVLRASRRPGGRPSRCTTSCTRRSSSPTTSTFVGSFNFSRSGERNAENVLEIHDAAIADRLATFVDEVRGRCTRGRRRPGSRDEREPRGCRQDDDEDRRRVRRSSSRSRPPSPQRLVGVAAPHREVVPGLPRRQRLEPPRRRAAGGGRVGGDRRRDRADEDDARRLRLRPLGRRADRDPDHGRRQGPAEEHRPLRVRRRVRPRARTRSRPASRSRAAPAPTATGTR